MTEEDEEFNRIEREAAMRKETVQPLVRTGNCLRVGVCASEGHKIQAQRTWVGLTDESVVSAAARVLSDRVAASMNVDCGDMWMLHGNDSIEDARAMLEAAKAKLKEKNT
jgi:hypothetical protein